MIVLFDLNGTLTDPAGIGEPWRLPELGAEVLDAAVRGAMADALLGAHRPFAEHLRGGLETRVAARLLDAGRIDAAVERAAALKPFPDAAEALDLLRDAGRRLAVRTNSGAESGRRTLAAAGLDDRFERILGVDAVRTFKPHPATYRHAVGELRAPAADITMVAAHDWDLAGAAHTGMRTAWIGRGGDRPSPVWPAPGVSADSLLDAARRIAGASG
jgi:2-haloacid dehalogenase